MRKQYRPLRGAWRRALSEQLEKRQYLAFTAHTDPNTADLAPVDSIFEHKPAGTPISDFVSDASGGSSWRLAGADGSQFQITANGQLQSTREFDYELQVLQGAPTKFNVTVQRLDNSGAVIDFLPVTITLLNVDIPANTFQMNLPEEQPIGQLVPSDLADLYLPPQSGGNSNSNYQLATGYGDKDNERFEILTLVDPFGMRHTSIATREIFNYETFVSPGYNQPFYFNKALPIPNVGVNDGLRRGVDVVNFAWFDTGSRFYYTIRVSKTMTRGDQSDELTDVVRLNLDDRTIAITNTFTGFDEPQVIENTLIGTPIASLSIPLNHGWGTAPTNPITYRLAIGAGDEDNGFFRIEGNNVIVNAPIDYEADHLRSIRVRATDATGRFREEQFTIRILDANDAPTDIKISNNSVPENQLPGMVVGFFSAVDQDPAFVDHDENPGTIFPNEWHTFYLLNDGIHDADNAAFEIVEITYDDDGWATPGESDGRMRRYELRTTRPLDFETQNVYHLWVQTEDSGGDIWTGVGGLTYAREITIDVTDTNELDFELSSSEINENVPTGSLAGFVNKVDTSESLIYQLVPGYGDNSLFSIQVQGGSVARGTITINNNPVDGATITLSDGTVNGRYTFEFDNDAAISNPANISVTIGPDAATTAANLLAAINASAINVTAISGGGATIALANDALGAFGNVGIGAFNIGTDIDVYGMTGGVDPIVHLLTNGFVPDFEVKPSYDVRIHATYLSDPSKTLEKTIQVGVNDMNDRPTDITLTLTPAVPNPPIGTLIGTLGTVDQDQLNPGSQFAGPYTYALVGGDPDNMYFRINGNRLETNADFYYEPNRSYQIRIRTTDNGGPNGEPQIFEKVFVIRPKDIAPTDISLSNSIIAENSPAGTIVGNFATTDADTNETFTYALPAGQLDNNLFTIVGSELRALQPFDFESGASYTILVQSTDSCLQSVQKVFTIVVGDANDAPTDMVLSPTVVLEGQPIGTLVGVFSTVDADAGDTFTYTFITGAGDADNTKFTISGNQLLTNDVFSFATQSTFSIRVRTTDSGGKAFDKSFGISLLRNAAPTDIQLDNNTVAEHQPAGALVGTFTTTDDPGDSFTYALVAVGSDLQNYPDWDKFTVNPTTGVLRANIPLDYEVKPSYTIRVSSTDLSGQSFEETFTIFVADIAEQGPTDIILSNDTVMENQLVGTAVGDLSTIDSDFGVTFSYSLVAEAGSNDNALFRIVGNQLQTNAVFDYEMRNSFTVRIRSTAGSLWMEKRFTIAIINTNDAPTDIILSPTSIQENRPAGTVVGGLSSVDQDTNETFSYSLASGAGATDNSSFEIVDDELRTKASFNYEVKNVYSIRIRSTDSGGGSVDKVFIITVTDVQDALPDFILTDNQVRENSPGGTFIGTLRATDPARTPTFAFVAGAGSDDNALFAITAEGQLVTAPGVVFDFETKNSYTIRISASDVDGTLEKSFIIRVTNVNDAPSEIMLSTVPIIDNPAVGTLVGTLSTTDQDAGDTFTYSRVSGFGDADNGFFRIVGNQLQIGASLAGEPDRSFSVRVRSTDSGGLYIERSFVINPSDPPTDIRLTSSTVDENAPVGTVVGNFDTTDPDMNETFTYAFANGATHPDNASFVIDAYGRLVSNAVFDHETKSSYLISVQVTDSGGWTFTKELTVTVGDVNEAPTDFTLTGNTVRENAAAGTVVGTFGNITPFDAGDTYAFALVAGTGDTDNASFTIDTLGQLITAPGSTFDFEGQTSYSIRVRVTDAASPTPNTLEKTFVITVLNDLDLPTDLSLDNASVAENQPVDTLVGTLSTTHGADLNDPFVYALVAGVGSTDNASFQIVGGQLLTNAIFDYEAQNSYSVRVRVTDSAGNTCEEAFTINITNVNESPIDFALSNSAVAENQPSGTIVGAFGNVAVPDAGDSYTYTLVAGTGDTDNASFTIDSSGQLLTGAIFNYELKNSYSIRVRVTDSAALTFEKVFTVNVTDANDAPTDLSLSNMSIAENQSVGTPVGTFSTTDEDVADTFTYTLVSGIGSADNAAFAIVGNQLRTAAVFNFEVKNSYSIRVRTTDSGGAAFEKQFTIAVTNANDAPINITLTAASIAENQPSGTLIGNLLASDDDAGDTHTYSLVDGASYPDNTAFSISGSELRSARMFDYETKNSYTIRIRTTDSGSLSFDKTFIISITNANDAPSDVHLSNTTVAEGLQPGAFIGFLTTNDQDPDQTFTYSVDRPDLFEVYDFNQALPAFLRTKAVLNFEATPYVDIHITATDNGGLSVTKAFRITVQDMNEPSTDLLLSSNTVAGGEAAGAVVGTFSTVDPDAGDWFTYSLVANAAGPDNALFAIVGNELRTAATLTGDSTYQIYVRSVDAGSSRFEKAFTITATSTVQPPAAPTAANDTVNTNGQSRVTINVLSNDKDSANSQLTVMSATAPQHGSLMLNPDGTITYNATLGWRGQDAFTYTMRSMAGLSASATVNVNVTIPSLSAVAVSGTAGDDVITARVVGGILQIQVNDITRQYNWDSVQSVTLYGQAGNDQITIEDSVTRGVTISGGTGNDIINGGQYADLIVGGNGNDTIVGNGGNDTLDGGAGDDSISGNDGNDSLTGGAGNDCISGGAGNDTVAGMDGADSIDGGAGADGIWGGPMGDSITGGDDDDIIYGGAGDDSIDGGGGNDSLVGEFGNDRIAGGDDNDAVHGNFGNDTILGGAGSDMLFGDVDSDEIHGGAGNDLIDGFTGNDLLFGDDGNDRILAGGGNDTAQGGNGNDTIYGGLGDDQLDGGAGNDWIQGGMGNDRLIGGAGADTLMGEGGEDVAQRDPLDLRGGIETLLN